MKKRIAVLGAGSWGTALASVLLQNQYKVTLWARRPEIAEEINQQHTNCHYLPQVQLDPELHATTELPELIRQSEVVLFVVPSHAMRQMVREVAPYLQPNTLLLLAAKGFEPGSLKRISEVVCEELPPAYHQRIAVLSGPSHAEEVVQRMPTTLVAASSFQETALETQSMFMNETFRVYTNDDLTGVEIGGALKNIIALAAGIAAGLDYGDNAKAALMTRGLAEIARLGIKLGAHPLTFVGLSGVGDLIVTCTSNHSRNWRAGYLLSQGKSVKEILDEMGMVVEGIKTTKAAYALAQKFRVEMPITEQLYQVLFADKKPERAVWELMTRGKTGEVEETWKKIDR